MLLMGCNSVTAMDCQLNEVFGFLSEEKLEIPEEYVNPQSLDSI